MRLLAKLPLWFLYAFSDFLFLVLFYIWGYRKKVVTDNLEKCFPDKSQSERRIIARKFYRHLCDVVVEVIKGHHISKKELKKRARITNPEVLREVIDKGQSALALTSHQCNWEWIILGCSAEYDFPLDALYKPLSNRYFDQFMLEVRGRFGNTPVATRNIVREIIRRKSVQRAFGILADQTPTKGQEKFWLQFMGRNTPFFTGSQKLAELTGYPVLFVSMCKKKRGYYEISFQKLATPPYQKGGDFIARSYASKVESQIRKQPECYLWSHRRWKFTKSVQGES
ncbi:lysophospholipid acyltransferase family protein [Roseivirga sp. BDSF3-8]|uniref:lysophospholipid acyltransferase family protein n=1 Tax=Roseivirga sp. BDSF3-8 TaxID=3241598 RepID=UPI003532632E